MSAPAAPPPMTSSGDTFEAWQIAVIAISGTITLLLLCYLTILCRRWSTADSATDPKGVVVEVPAATVVGENDKDNYARRQGGKQAAPPPPPPPPKTMAQKVVEPVKAVAQKVVVEPVKAVAQKGVEVAVKGGTAAASVASKAGAAAKKIVS